MLKITIPLLLILLFFLDVANAQKWQPGYYYDNDGSKNVGFIANYVSPATTPDPNTKFFLFKRNPNDDYTRIFAANITSFVVARDSFVVSDSKILNETPFVQAVGNSKLKLYIAKVPRQTPDFGLASGIGFLSVGVETSFPYTKNKYYYGNDPDHLTELARKDFKDVMSNVMADNPDIVAKIQSKKYRYSDMKDLLKYYQTGKEPGYTADSKD